MKRKTAKMKGLSLLLALAMIVTSLTIWPTQVQAASKAYLSTYTQKIGINGTISVSEYLTKRSKASYSFSSSKSSVAKVSSKGKITGVKVGTAKITVTEKYKGKSKKLGSFKVQVKKSCVYNDISYGQFWWTTQPGYFEKNPDKLNIKDCVNYINPKATYKFYSSDSSKMKISEKGVVSAVNGPDGDYVWITIKETYKKTTRTVGKFKGYMYAPYGDKETTWYVGNYYDVPLESFAAAYICWDESQWTDAEIQKEQDYRNSADYKSDPSTGDDNSLLKSELDDDGYLVDYLAQKTGTAYFYIYLLNYKTNQYEYLGYPITVKVEEYVDEDDYDEDDDY